MSFDTKDGIERHYLLENIIQTKNQPLNFVNNRFPQTWKRSIASIITMTEISSVPDSTNCIDSQSLAMNCDVPEIIKGGHCHCPPPEIQSDGTRRHWRRLQPLFLSAHISIVTNEQGERDRDKSPSLDGR